MADALPTTIVSENGTLTRRAMLTGLVAMTAASCAPHAFAIRGSSDLTPSLSSANELELASDAMIGSAVKLKNAIKNYDRWRKKNPFEVVFLDRDQLTEQQELMRLQELKAIHWRVGIGEALKALDAGKYPRYVITSSSMEYQGEKNIDHLQVVMAVQSALKHAQQCYRQLQMIKKSIAA